MKRSSRVLFRFLSAFLAFQLLAGSGFATSERTRVRIENSQRRCPFCHDNPEQQHTNDEWVHCSRCGTGHHQDCAQEAKNCAIGECSHPLPTVTEGASRAEIEDQSEKSGVAAANLLNQQLHLYATMSETGADEVALDLKLEQLLKTLNLVLGLSSQETSELPIQIANIVRNYDQSEGTRINENKRLAAMWVGKTALGLTVLTGVLTAIIAALNFYRVPYPAILQAIDAWFQANVHPAWLPAIIGAELGFIGVLIAKDLTMQNAHARKPLSLDDLNKLSPSNKVAVSRTQRGFKHLRGKLGEKYGPLPEEDSRFLVWLVDRILNPKLLCSNAL